MSSLSICYALPNPAGKDRTPANQVTNDQLNGEWIEFSASRAASIQDVALSHRTFDARCTRTGEEQLTSFVGALAAGQSIRVHTGTGTDGWSGTVLHVYLGRRNFVWNNRCGDIAFLTNAGGHLIDHAYYDPQPPEGAVLYREIGTNHLAVGAAIPAYRR